jgi:hypothetical protein
MEEKWFFGLLLLIVKRFVSTLDHFSNGGTTEGQVGYRVAFVLGEDITMASLKWKVWSLCIVSFACYIVCL